MALICKSCHTCSRHGSNPFFQILLGPLQANILKIAIWRDVYKRQEVKNLVKLEEKIVTGPYVHHCVGIHGDVIPAVYEALKYIPGIKPDLYDDNEEEIRAFLRGE